MNEIRDRLMSIVGYSGLNRVDFARHCDINYNTFSSCITGIREINLEIIQKVLAAYPEVEEGWLLLGRGFMFSAKVQAALRRNQ